MARPSQVHQNKTLERISVAFRPIGMVHQELSPTISVKHESDIFYVYSKDNMRVPETRWADSAQANRAVTWNVSTSTYTLVRHGLEELVTDRLVANADSAIKPLVDATENITDKIMLRKEIDLLSIINTASNFANTTSLSTTQHWNVDTTLSNPIIFIDSATTAIRRNASKIANTVVLPDATFKAVKEHQSIVDRVKHTSMQSVGPDILATLFNVDKVLISGAVQNTGEQDLADALTDVMTDNAFVAFIERSPGLKKPSAVYTFVKEGSTTPIKMETYRDDPHEGDVVRGSSFFEHKFIATECAYLIVNTAS